MTEFDPREQEALDAWTVPEPPPELANAVLRRLDASRTRRWQWAVAAGALLSVAAGAWWWTRDSHASARGDFQATGYEQIALAGRGTLVASAGATGQWVVSSDGAVEVSQTAGQVFYRAETGAQFDVETPLGRISVRGTCFDVEIRPMKAMQSGVVGAALAAAIVVTVYEGQVLAESPNEAQAVSAGQTATIHPEGTISVVTRESSPSKEPTVAGRASDRSRPARAEIASPNTTPSTSAPTPAGASEGSPAKATARLKALESENAQLAQQVEALKKRVAQADLEKADSRTYGLSAQKLKDLADGCELRWDHPGISLDGYSGVPPKTASSLELDETEQAVLLEEMNRTNDELLDAVRTIYAEVVGQEAPLSTAPSALIAEVVDKTTTREKRLAFQRLSAERAGRIDAPTEEEAPGRPALERLYRTLTRAGDALEGRMATRLSPERAREIRDIHEGFGSRSRSTYGCPK